jgi:ComF family protein
MVRKAALPAWTDFWRQGLEFVFRSPCPLCQRAAAPFFCRDCHQKLLGCRRSVSKIEVPGLPPLYCWGRYEGALKQSLAKLKYDRQRRIAEPLGNWLAELWQPQSTRSWVAVPIPLHRDREQQRGYNQAQLIAQSFCQSTGLALRSQGLIRPQATTAQYGLSRLDRYQNLQSAFNRGPDLQNLSSKQSVVIIDDIFTTGATFKAAVETLQNSGIQVAALFAIAASERGSSQR